MVTFAHTGIEPLRCHPQHLVTGGMAERIVDLLEIIQIDAHECKCRAALGTPPGRLLQQLVETRPVQGTTERVVVRDVQPPVDGQALAPQAPPELHPGHAERDRQQQRKRAANAQQRATRGGDLARLVDGYVDHPQHHPIPL